MRLITLTRAEDPELLTLDVWPGDDPEWWFRLLLVDLADGTRRTPALDAVEFTASDSRGHKPLYRVDADAHEGIWRVIADGEKLTRAALWQVTGIAGGHRTIYGHGPLNRQRPPRQAT